MPYRNTILVYLFLLTFTFSLPINAQNNADTVHLKERSYQINTGYLNAASVDKLFSDQVYSGGGIYYGLSHWKSKRIESQTSYGFSRFNRYPQSLQLAEEVLSEHHPLRYKNNIHFEVNDLYIFPLKQNKQRQIELFATGTWFTSIDLIYNQKLIPELITSYLAPGFMARYQTELGTFSAGASSALIAYTCRSNYSTTIAQDYETMGKFRFIRENSHIQLPNSFSTLSFNIGYKVPVSKHLILHFDYHFRYLWNSRPRMLKSVSGIYSIGLAYYLKK